MIWGLAHDASEATTTSPTLNCVHIQPAFDATCRYVLDHNLPIDTSYYLTNQLKEPMMRLFEPIIGKSKAQSLFTGDHTFKVVSSKPTKSAGGLMAFVERSEPCLGAAESSPRQHVRVSCVVDSTTMVASMPRRAGADCKNAVKKSAAKVCSAFCAECRTDM